MMKDTKTIARTAILLAICIFFQVFKGISVYISGPMVNLILVFAALSCGLAAGLIIAIVTPLSALIIGATPVLTLMPVMIPVIMVGNCIIVLFAWAFRSRLLVLGIGLGAVCKAAFLWLTVWYAVIPVFGKALPPKMVPVIKTTFSVTQLITALIGGYLALLIYWRLRPMLSAGKETPVER